VLLVAGAMGVAQTQEQQPQQPQKPAAQKPAADTAKQPNVNPDEYIIGTDDLLAINVWKEPDLTRTVPVRPDGKITLPLIGDMVASGLTPRQLQESIAKALVDKEMIAHPDVTVMVQEVRSQKFNIVGQIEKPGTYSLIKPMTVLDGIAAAGGLKEFAKGKKIYVLRTNPDGTRVRLPFNYAQVIKGENMAQNVELIARDTIVVP
jgi:polysaccharide export outer membrane protein